MKISLLITAIFLCLFTLQSSATQNIRWTNIHNLVFTDTASLVYDTTGLTVGPTTESQYGVASSLNVLHAADNGSFTFVITDQTADYTQYGFAANDYLYYNDGSTNYPYPDGHTPSSSDYFPTLLYYFNINSGNADMYNEDGYIGNTRASVGDTFKLAKRNNVIYFYKNGIQLDSEKFVFTFSYGSAPNTGINLNVGVVVETPGGAIGQMQCTFTEGGTIDLAAGPYNCSFGSFDYPITWNFLQDCDVEYEGTTLTKISSLVDYAFAFSANKIYRNVDGFIDYQVIDGDLGKVRSFGFSDVDTGSIAINGGGFWITSGDEVEIFDDGSLVGTYGSADEADILEVQKINNQLIYKKNGEQIYVGATNESNLYVSAQLSSDASRLFNLTASFGVPLDTPVISPSSLSYCTIDDSLTLSVTNPQNWAHYYWYKNNSRIIDELAHPLTGTSVTIGRTAGVNSYRAKAVDNYGDTLISNEATVSISVLADTTYSSHETCYNNSKNGSVTLLASGGIGSYSYNWKTVPMQTTSTATGLHSGAYQVTVTDGNSCTLSEIVNVLPLSNPQLTMNTGRASSDSSSDGYARVIATGGQGNYSYSWGALSQTTDSVSGLANGIYMVTVTDSLSCQTSRAASLAFYTCNSGSDVVFNGGLHSIVNSYSYGGDIILNSGATLAIGSTSSQITVGMNSGKKISVCSTCTLSVHKSILINDCPEMWKGIELEAGAVLSVDNSTIENAEYGIHFVYSFAATATNYSITFTNFIDDYVGIYVETPIVNGLIYGCNFISPDAKLIDPYTGQADVPMPGLKTYAGIKAENGGGINSFFIGSSIAQNTFTGINFGIFSWDVYDLRVINSYFQDILGYDDPNYGVGIYTYYKPNYNGYLQQTGFGKYGPSSFLDCQIGIHAEGVNSIINENRMTNMNIGIQEYHTYQKGTSITNNYIDCNRYGLDFNQNPGSTTSVENNDIILGRIGNIWNYSFGGKCIQIIESLYNNSPYVISKNHLIVWQGHVGGSDSYGIRALNPRSLIIKHNLVDLNNSAYKSNGIVLANCQQLWGVGLVQCNTVQNDPVLSIDNIDYHVTNSPRYRVECNIASYAEGFYFEDNCKASEFWSNTGDHNNNYALCIGCQSASLSQIGVQMNTKNYWLGTEAALCLSPTSLSQFYYGVSGTPTSWFPSDFFVYNLSINLYVTDCYGPHGNCGAPMPLAASSNDTQIDTIDILTAENSLPSDVFFNTVNWTGSKYLYEKLKRDTTLAETDTLFQNFISKNDTSSIGYFYNIEKGIDHIYTIDSAVQVILNSNNLRIQNYDDQILVNDEIILSLDTSSHAIIDSLNEVNEYISDSVSALIFYNDSALNNLDSMLLLNIANLQTDNGLIAVSEIYEINEKEVNDIFLSTLAIHNSNFTEDQITTLLYIANQCPESGGNAVYNARGLLNLVNDSIIYNDSSVCACTECRVGKQGHSNKRNNLSIYPNPTTGNMTMKFTAESAMPYTVQIMDMTGRILINEEHLAKKGINFDYIYLNQLSKGIYFVRYQSMNVNEMTRIILE